MFSLNDNMRYMLYNQPPTCERVITPSATSCPMYLDVILATEMSISL